MNFKYSLKVNLVGNLYHVTSFSPYSTDVKENIYTILIIQLCLKIHHYIREEINMNRKELAEKLKAEAEANRAETIKTSDTPQPLKPTEKAKALLRKTDSKYINHVSKKLLPGLD